MHKSSCPHSPSRLDLDERWKLGHATRSSRVGSFRRGCGVLYDRRAVAAPLDDTFTRAATEAIEQRADRLGGCQWAVVIGDQPALNVVHMTAVLGERAGVEARPFFVPEDALAWLVGPG